MAEKLVIDDQTTKIQDDNFQNDETFNSMFLSASGWANSDTPKIEKNLPKNSSCRLLYDISEKIRYEILGTKILKGISKNLKDFISLNFRYENDFDKRSITISTNQKNIINEF